MRQAEVVSPEFNAFKRKLKLTILMTLVSEQQHDHREVSEAESHAALQAVTTGAESMPALGAGETEADLFLEQLRAHLAAPTPIPRKES